MTPLDRVTERVNRLGPPDDPATPTPLLTVAEFFDGNTTTGSIGCNLTPTPARAEFHALFIAISQRAEVADIRVQVTMFDDPDWPFSDTLYIMTTANAGEVETWFPEQLAPDEVWEGFAEQAYEPYDVPAGMKVVGCWWD